VVSQNGRLNLPFAGDPLERIDATMLELEPGACDCLHDGPRCQDITWTGQSGDTSTDMYSDTTKIITAYLALPGVNACPDLQTKMTSTVGHHLCAADGAGRAIETGQEPVACLLDFPSPEVTETIPDHLVVSLQKATPDLIALGSRSSR